MSQPHYMLGRHGATCYIEVSPPHPWHRLIYEAAARARGSNAQQLEVVVAIEGVVQVLNVREIDISDRHGVFRIAVTAKPWGDPFPIPATEKKTPARGNALADELSDALDLLDSLVDPLLDIGVCKGRVQTWKKMMRDKLKAHKEAT